MNNGDMPANPVKRDNWWENFLKGIGGGKSYGLTKREHFAGLAMEGLLIRFREQIVSCDDIAKCAVEQADALLKELEK